MIVSNRSRLLTSTVLLAAAINGRQANSLITSLVTPKAVGLLFKKRSATSATITTTTTTVPITADEDTARQPPATIFVQHPLENAVGLDHPLPPRDDTFSPITSVRELLAAPDNADGSRRYDGIGRATGGIWRSRAAGIIPSTVISAPLGTRWMAQQEAAGHITNSLPPSTAKLIGPNAIGLLARQPDAHSSVRRVFSQALSPKAVLKLLPVMEASLEERCERWEELAASGEELPMLDEINSYTLEVISRCFLGDYATVEVVKDIKRLLPIICKGLMSVPMRFPWPLRKIPAFSFGQGMAARKEFKEIFEGVLLDRQVDMTAGGAVLNAGVLDTLLDMQQRQRSMGGALEGEILFDDDFIFDNMSFFLFAGYDTTAAALARILQLLGSKSSKDIVDQLIDEINGTVAAASESELEECPHSREATATKAQRRGVLASYPFLDAVIHEATRIYPIIGGVFRKALRDLNFRGYRIPEGTNILWNTVSANHAESLYPEPKKFCPFRFLHGDKSSSTPDDPAATSEQQPPPMFGFGKHMCPGREVAKLEILVFLKVFLSNFDYEMVKGQSYKSTLPLNAPKGNLRIILKSKAKKT